jgi:hypothetical protein
MQLTMNPVPLESGTSFSEFLIFMCSAWKFPSIMKPHMKRTLLKKCFSSYVVLMPIDIPIFILSPIIREVDSRLGTQCTEHSHWSRLCSFIFLIPKAKSLLGNESSPLLAYPQQLLILVLSLSVSQSFGIYTESPYRYSIWELVICESP